MKQVGTTNDAGEASVILPDDTWLEIVARKEEFAVANLVVRSPTPPECVLRLSPETTLSGKVVLANKDPGGEDLVVLALPQRRALVMHDAPERIWDEPEVAETRTDPQGNFTLRGLDSAQDYELIAGGRGFVQDAPVEDIRPGAADVELVVSYGYAARIELRDPAGETPRMGRVFGTGIGATAGLVQHEAHFVRHAELYALLSGVVIEPRPGPFDLVYVTSAPGLSSEVTLQLYMQPPGYGLVRTDVALTRLSEGLRAERLTLAKLAADFGTIEIERVGGSPSGFADTRIGPFAVLTLYPEQGLAWHFPLFDARLARQSLEHIPFGRYRCVLSVLSSRNLIPAPDEKERFIEVGPQPVVLRFDGTSLGAIEVQVHDAAGSIVEGELVLFLGEGTYDPARSGTGQAFNGEYVYFRHPPYVIDNLPAAPHSLFVDTVATGGGWQSVEVEAGRTKPVKFTLAGRAR